MGLSNELSHEAGSFSLCHLNPHWCFQLEASRLYFPTLEPWFAVSLGPQLFLLVYVHVNAGPVVPPWLPVSTPPTGPGECFFFNSLVVKLPYSLIFWQFWLFLFLNLLFSFFWLFKESQCVYLHLLLGRKSISSSF